MNAHARFRRLVLISMAFLLVPGAVRAQTGPDLITLGFGFLNPPEEKIEQLAREGLIGAGKVGL